MKQNIIYKIYMGRKCVYIGVTNGDLTATLRVHFFGEENVLDLERVSKVEYAVLPSLADCFVDKTYLINSLKPLYNKSDRARDELSEHITLPELKFVEYNNPIMEKWKDLLKNGQLTLRKEDVNGTFI